MNDQPTPDARSRASAYLDGELDAAELAAAEADPAVMAEVAQLRSLQAAIRDVPESTSYARDTAIAAALVEFDRRRHPAPVVRVRPRPAYSRWLAVAAAVAGLAALGAVITTSARGGDDDAADDAAAAEEAAGGAFDAGLSSRATAAAQPESPQSQTMLAAESTDAPAATESAAAGADAAATTAAPVAVAEAAIQPPFDSSTPIPDEVELGRIGRQLLAEWTAGTRATMTGTACDSTVTNLVVLSDAVLIVQGASQSVLVAGDPATDETFALDPGTCIVVATGQ